jgi:hypothetical protein
MPIISSDLDWIKAANTAQDSSGGGVMSNPENRIVPDAINGLFPDLQQSQLAAGGTFRKKVFLKNNHATLTLQDTRIYLWMRGLSDGKWHLHAGTQTDTIGTIGGSPRKYSVGRVSAPVSAGAASTAIVTYGSAYNAFQVGDTVVLTDQEDTDDATGNLEVLQIGAVSYSGDTCTITWSSPPQHQYAASRVGPGGGTVYTRVASCLNAGSVVGSVASIAKVSSAGSYDNAQYPPVVGNIGGVRDTWTFTFTSSTTFSVSGAAAGAIGTGTVGGSFAPTNPNTGTPYFTVSANFWTGTWATGNTLTLVTNPAAAPFWLEYVVPPGMSPVSPEQVYMAAIGHSGSV